MQTYNPVEKNFADIYVVEKIGTKQGWACTSPDEDWFTGYPQEIEAFYRTIAYGEPSESDISLAADAIATIYSATCRPISGERPSWCQKAMARYKLAGPIRTSCNR